MSRSNAKRRQTRPSGERWPPPGRLSLRICKHAVVSVASELGRARDQARQRRQNGGCYKSQARDVVSGRLYSPGFASPLDLGRLRGASSNASPPWRPQRQSHRPVTQAMEMRRRSMRLMGWPWWVAEPEVEQNSRYCSARKVACFQAAWRGPHLLAENRSKDRRRHARLCE